jgi:uncharacterized protein YydD (DUF2326 family)
MIVSIGSSIRTFKTVTFHAGLNVLLADIAGTSTDKHTRNSAGKTSLVEILHFLLGSSPEKGSLFKKPEIVPHSFTGEFLFGDNAITITRKVSDDGRLLVDGEEAAALKLVLRHDEETDLHYLAVDDWKAFLGKAWFGLPRDREGTEFAGAYAPSFRSLIGYFARRRRIGGFSHIDKQNEHQQPWDSQVNLSYLLGLSWDAPRAIQDLRTRRATLKSLRKAIRSGELGEMFATAAEIRPELARAEERIERLKRQVSTFQVLESFREQADRVAAIKNRMSQLAGDRALARETVTHLERVIKDEKPPQYADVESLYRAAGVELPTVALKRFEDVEKFQASVVQNRKRYLEEQLKEANQSIVDMDAILKTLDDEKAAILRQLDGKGAFEDLENIREDLAVMVSRAEVLREKLQNASVLESNQTAQRIESAELERRLQEDHARHENAIKSATVLFDQAIARLYDDRTGNLVIAATKDGPKFEITIQGGGNLGGIDMMKLYCFDIMLYQLSSERFGGPTFLVHDSHLFDGVDERQIGHAIAYGAEIAQRTSGQYIVMMNSDEFAQVQEEVTAAQADAVLPVRLTDDEAGGLFGFRFD